MGLAETNSILNFFLFLSEPNFFLFFRVFSINLIQALLVNLIFKKPGPAISIFEKSTTSFKSIFFNFTAKSLGLFLEAFAKTIAAFEEKS